MDEYKAFLLNVGQALKSAREDAGMTQVELAKSIGTSQSAIYYYETGKVCMMAWTLFKLCEALRTSSDEVLGLASDESIDRAIQYAHDTGFDEGYETAQAEREECEAYVIPGGLQCGNCGAIVASIVDEGVSEDE